MDLNALKKKQQQLDSRSGSDGFLSRKDLTADGMVVRLVPPSPQLDGMFHLEVKKYWFPTPDGKKQGIICVSTFGKDSVIEEELAMANESEDEELLELVQEVKLQSENWMGVLQLVYKKDRNDNVIGVEVVDGHGKILQVPNTCLNAIIKLATNKMALKEPTKHGSTDGIADREYGSNMLLSKTGKALSTKYDAALDEQMEIEEKYYRDLPDVYTVAKNQMKSVSMQRALIREYLYGEAIPKAVKAKEDARVEALKASRPSTVKKKPTAASDDDDDEDEAPAPKKKAAKKPVEEDEDEDDEPAPVKKKSKKPVDEDDEDEAPPFKPVGKKKAAILLDADDDDDDYEVPATKKGKKQLEEDDDDDEPIPAKKKATPPAPAKKAAPKKKTIVDEDDDEEEDIQPVKKKSSAPVAGKGAKKTILDDLDLDEDDDE